MSDPPGGNLISAGGRDGDAEGRQRAAQATGERPPRELRFERKMSDAEAMMWMVEKDPWLNPNGMSVSVLDRRIDFERIRSRIAYGVAMVPRLRDRVVSGLGRLSPPEWAPDPEFDLDYHIRHVALPEPGSQRQLLDLAAQLYQDPYDRSRPLWYFVLIDGLEGGRSALVSKMHHSLADGIAGLRLSELYVDGRRDAPDPPAVDLDAVIAADAAGCPGEGGRLRRHRGDAFARPHLATPARHLSPHGRRGGHVGCRSTAPARPRRRCSRTGAAAPRPGDGARSGSCPRGLTAVDPTFAAPALRDAARPARCGAGDRQGARRHRQRRSSSPAP